MMYDVIVIGSGPAGLTAAIYTTRANLKTLIIGGVSWGGQLMLTTEVENFPGFPQGIMGPDLMANMRKQAEKFGAEIVEENFTSEEFSASNGKSFTIRAGDRSFEGRSVILATGADTKWLDVPGEKEKIGRGVSTCAPCDGPFFKNKDVIVVGGGDSAMEEAEVMTRYATSVTLIHRRDTLRASKIMQDKIKSNPKIKIILDTQVSKILGDFKVTGVELANVKTGEKREMATDGVFVAIGHIPNTALFKGIDLDEKGYIKVYEHTKTNVEGVFVAGDVHDIHYKQAITAAGFGCMAALEVEKWLREQNSK
ncbi:MAG: thioredoxin-disulfide reductase [Candidatus Levybacteria bacterium CG_4_9_14_3_um_filter_35_16]|nr:MAG: thioredoxin-disulfide reductase [Candidatus Levybacteria bacterium CG22_combo_CG10-13_8_21_14_all_35_11]PIZ97322.1 MAG: thioredoxin-disulfide reductase [Candidatus Levybacteria bacterium CG_4_10_14_0_2_um_filter_35_8]PJA91011.1 MAG: thioredoxin-disulfide reductase [Candidatus Levybacteria bacterium CG_4_9_14_3_um_filter_35_16]PJC54752.1 MAG: thioredoxin-disulfide reductase [Candidatus Levybacteria bacterium CG_4_9_14_0_2_um_filter_35_21]